MDKYRLFLKRFNYIEVVQAESLRAAKTALLSDFGFPISKGTFLELKKVSPDEELEGDLKPCPHCRCALCHTKTCPPREPDLRAYNNWVLKNKPPYALLPCLYQTIDIKPVKVSGINYERLYKFDWYLNSQETPVTIVEVAGKNETVDIKTIKIAVATLTEEYEKFGETVYLGDWSGMDYRERIDIAMLSMHGEHLPDRKLNFPQNREQYVEYLEKNPAFLEKIKTAAFIKRQRVKQEVKKYERLHLTPLSPLP